MVGSSGEGEGFLTFDLEGGRRGRREGFRTFRQRDSEEGPVQTTHFEVRGVNLSWVTLPRFFVERSKVELEKIRGEEVSGCGTMSRDVWGRRREWRAVSLDLSWDRLGCVWAGQADAHWRIAVRSGEEGSGDKTWQSLRIVRAPSAVEKLESVSRSCEREETASLALRAWSFERSHFRVVSDFLLLLLDI
jgi:hypothetical protein